MIKLIYFGYILNNYYLLNNYYQSGVASSNEKRAKKPNRRFQYIAASAGGDHQEKLLDLIVSQIMYSVIFIVRQLSVVYLPSRLEIQVAGPVFGEDDNGPSLALEVA